MIFSPYHSTLRDCLSIKKDAIWYSWFLGDPHTYKEDVQYPELWVGITTVITYYETYMCEVFVGFHKPDFLS